MTPDEYIQKLAELKQHAQRAVITSVPALEKQAYSLVVAFIDANMDIKDGRFVPGPNAVIALNRFTDVFISAMLDLKDYRGAVGGYLKNFKSIGALIEEFQQSRGIDIAKARLGAVQEVVINEIVNRYSENGLNQHFVQPLRSLLFENVVGGLSKVEAMKKLREFIQGGKDVSGKLGRYLEQTAQQAVDSYTGAVNTRIMNTFKIDTLLMSGSLIKTSSPQCVYVVTKLKGIIDRKDWPKLKEIADDNGLVEDTTFDTLPFNKLHWGCRHEFTPVVLNDEQRKKLLTQKLNKA